jgi:hypothetical protein
MSRENHVIHGFAGRMVDTRQSALDRGLVVVEIQNAQGGHCASVVLTPKGAKQLSDALEHQAQVAIAANLLAEMAVNQ